MKKKHRRKLKWFVALQFLGGHLAYPDPAYWAVHGKPSPRCLTRFAPEDNFGFSMQHAMDFARVVASWLMSDEGKRTMPRVRVTVHPARWLFEGIGPETKVARLRLTREWAPPEYWKANGDMALDEEGGDAIPYDFAGDIQAALQSIYPDARVEVWLSERQIRRSD